MLLNIHCHIAKYSHKAGQDSNNINIVNLRDRGRSGSETLATYTDNEMSSKSNENTRSANALKHEAGTREVLMRRRAVNADNAEVTRLIATQFATPPTLVSTENQCALHA